MSAIPPLWRIREELPPKLLSLASWNPCSRNWNPWKSNWWKQQTTLASKQRIVLIIAKDLAKRKWTLLLLNVSRLFFCSLMFIATCEISNSQTKTGQKRQRQTESTYDDGRRGLRARPWFLSIALWEEQQSSTKNLGSGDAKAMHRHHVTTGVSWPRSLPLWYSCNQGKSYTLQQQQQKKRTVALPKPFI